MRVTPSQRTAPQTIHSPSGKRACVGSRDPVRATHRSDPHKKTSKMATLGEVGITERAPGRDGDAQGTLRSPMPPRGARIAPAPLQAPRVGAWTDAPSCASPNAPSSSQSTEQTAVVELQPQARRTPRLPSDVRRSSLERTPELNLQRLHAPRPLPQWGTVIQRDFLNLETLAASRSRGWPHGSRCRLAPSCAAATWMVFYATVGAVSPPRGTASPFVSPRGST